MVSKASDSSSKTRKSHGEQSNEGVVNFSHKLNQLKKQIQAERIITVKEKVEKNKRKLETHVSQLILATSRNDVLSADCSAHGRILSSRINYPLCKYGGFTQGPGDGHVINGHEIIYSASINLPYIEKIPPYTTWIFLDRNQRMAEDQSIVGRRRIYYDQHGSEALVCSDSEEDLVEPEEPKHKFTDGEDRILWMALEDHGLDEQVLNIVTQFIGATSTEIEERYSMLKEKFHEKLDLNFKDSGDSGSERGIMLDKSLSAGLDSFDNLFCRRCLLFDCRLHGCSQTLVNPSEKQTYWSEYEDDRKPCSDQCYLQVKVVKNLLEGSVTCDWRGTKFTALEENKRIIVASDADKPKAAEETNFTLVAETMTPVSTYEDPNSNLDETAEVKDTGEYVGKRKIIQHANAAQDTSANSSKEFQDSLSKRQRKLLTLDVVVAASEAKPSLDHNSTGVIENVDLQITGRNTVSESTEHTLKESMDVTTDGAKDVTEVHEPHSSSSSPGGDLGGIAIGSDWKPIEKELFLKGVEMFGKNSCLIARNLLSGLKTCVEVSNYICGSGATVPHRFLAPSLSLEECGKSETDNTEQEMPTRSRLLRRRGRTRKLKYSRKSAGHPSFRKRIADGKSQSCKQYSPCGCQSMCGKQCPCMLDGTCCEKYCGCSKSCKNRFRGCHCAKSQCRSRQCPCFAAGRECDPDVCRNCWVSCGDGSLGEPTRRGDGQCGNMRLLLRQQQRILLGKSDIAGWGAFLKNPVNKNDYLGEYTGELISHREADKRGKTYDLANSSFLFDLNDQYVLDAYRQGDKLKFANHSSNPNCYAKVMLVAGDHRVGIFANEHIEAGEELFYDYRYGPDEAPAWARKPEGSKRDDSSVSQGRAKKHQSH
ncbi:histone-lysine N-methyltransferase EZA1-like isoform X1 [Tripterygium wilfordii]|uniref:histone-lysine N-methyltransferase EZA1-like isoform X1 n=1 Tax=Tripterygium wilfordii TaxID=458696 RepID=UPI0018F7F182|nr:histone-lysine N-methyltransferase EZA1-like isoform X1 [Tripterygium wilfordii]